MTKEKVCKFCGVLESYGHLEWCKLTRAPSPAEALQAVINEEKACVGGEGPSALLAAMAEAALAALQVEPEADVAEANFQLRRLNKAVEALEKPSEPIPEPDYLKMLARLQWARYRILDRSRPEMVFVSKKVWDEVFGALGRLDDPDAKPENREAPRK